jgi:hypothetical protein
MVGYWPLVGAAQLNLVADLSIFHASMQGRPWPSHGRTRTRAEKLGRYWITLILLRMLFVGAYVSLPLLGQVRNSLNEEASLPAKPSLLS